MIRNITELQSYLQNKNFTQLFLLVDENTAACCMPLLVEKAEEIADRQAVLLEIPAGENQKNITTTENIINQLSESEADRNSCVISLGGGVICDLGGFVCSIYKRGIQNINVPTTLLSMVDASIGGKTGINHGEIKNLIGTFNSENEVFIDTDFLSTLQTEQIKDGMAEMLKTFIVSDEELLSDFITSNPINNINRDLVLKCGRLKEKIVASDFYDKGKRRILNFGHTLGHAVEMFYGLSHGHSVAVGMDYAMDLSVKYCGFPIDKAEKIKQFIAKHYSIPNYKTDMESLIPLMRQDKKNNGGKINLILLEDIGKPCLFEYNI